MIRRIALAALALAVGGLLAWGCETLRGASLRDYAAWAAVPTYTAAQLEDLPAGAPVLQVVALDAPDDAGVGLATYVVEVERCRTTTRTDKDGTVHTSRSCSWQTTAAHRPAPLPIRLIDSSMPGQVLGTPRLEGPQRTVDLGQDASGDALRAVGWARGDALLVVGTTGREPGQFVAAQISGQTRAAWLSGYQVAGMFWRVATWVCGLAAVAGAAALVIGEGQ